MSMVNGLAAAKPVILLNSKTRCSQPLFLCDRSDDVKTLFDLLHLDDHVTFGGKP